MASRSSATPATGVYLVKFAWMAATAASLMCGGVWKCGSPAPKSTRSAPEARILSASATTAMVAETSMRLIRSASAIREGVATDIEASCLQLWSSSADRRRNSLWLEDRYSSIVTASAESAKLLSPPRALPGLRDGGMRPAIHFALQAFFHQVRDQALDRSAETDDLLHQPRTDIGVSFGRHHEHSLDLRAELAVHQGHLQLVFVIADGANAAENDRGIHLLGVFHQQALEGVHPHVVVVCGSFLQHVAAFRQREERVLFRVTQDRHYQLFKNFAASRDQVEVAVGERIEGPGIDGNNVLQAASVEVEVRAEILCCTPPGSKWEAGVALPMAEQQTFWFMIGG